MKKSIWVYVVFMIVAGICAVLVATQSFVKKVNAQESTPKITLAYDAAPTLHYIIDKSGKADLRSQPTKKYYINITPGSPNGGSIDIRGLHLKNIVGKLISASRPTSDAGLVPIVAFKSVSTSTISYNIAQPDSQFASEINKINICIEITGY